MSERGPELPRALADVSSFLENYSPVGELRYYHGDTVLHQLLHGRHEVDVVRSLLDGNAAVHINTQNDKMQTPLHCILQKSHPPQDIIKLLLEYQASLTLEDHLKHPPFFSYAPFLIL